MCSAPAAFISAFADTGAVEQLSLLAPAVVLTPAGLQMFRDYAHRAIYSLYLYSIAAGDPLRNTGDARHVLGLSDDPARDECTQYMLGDFLLVTSYTEELRLPRKLD